jgi:hypothetical protein
VLHFIDSKNLLCRSQYTFSLFIHIILSTSSLDDSGRLKAPHDTSIFLRVSHYIAKGFAGRKFMESNPPSSRDKDPFSRVCCKPLSPSHFVAFLTDARKNGITDSKGKCEVESEFRIAACDHVLLFESTSESTELWKLLLSERGPGRSGTNSR